MKVAKLVWILLLSTNALAAESENAPKAYSVGIESPLFTHADLAVRTGKTLEVSYKSSHYSSDTRTGDILDYERTHASDTEISLSSALNEQKTIIGVNIRNAPASTQATSVDTSTSPDTSTETILAQQMRTMTLNVTRIFLDKFVLGLSANHTELGLTASSGAFSVTDKMFWHSFVPQLFFRSNGYEFGLIYKDQIKINRRLKRHEAGTTTLVLQKRTSKDLFGLSITQHRMNELNETLKDGLTIRVGAERRFFSRVALSGSWSWTPSFAEKAPTINADTIAKNEWTVGTRLILDDETSVHVGYRYLKAPKTTAAVAKDVLVGAFASQETVSVSLSQVL